MSICQTNPINYVAKKVEWEMYYDFTTRLALSLNILVEDMPYINLEGREKPMLCIISFNNLVIDKLNAKDKKGTALEIISRSKLLEKECKKEAVRLYRTIIHYHQQNVEYEYGFINIEPTFTGNYAKDYFIKPKK